MTPLELTLLAAVFLTLALAVVGLGLMQSSAPDPEHSSADPAPVPEPGTTVGLLTATVRRIGERVPDKGGKKEDSIRQRLTFAGFRGPGALDIMQGSQVAAALFLAVSLILASLWQMGDFGAAALAAVAGGGLGYLIPERFLDWRVSQRRAALRRHLPNALDLLILSVEAGQSLDQSCAEAGRQLQRTAPALAEEFQLINLETRAGKTREEALRNLGLRNGEPELKRLSTILIDSDRFGTNLAPTLRTQARYLRTRARQQAQERARKIGVKLVFPLVLLIFPSMLLVTLGPPVAKMIEVLGKGMNL